MMRVRMQALAMNEGKRWKSKQLVGKHFSSSFYCEGNDEQADPKCNRCERNWLAESAHSADERGHRKVDPCGNEATERSRERKRGRPHLGPVLLRQPKTEDGEVAAEEA